MNQRGSMLWSEVPLHGLDVRDGATMARLLPAMWDAICRVLEDVRFAVPSAQAELEAHWEDVIRQANLNQWHPTQPVAVFPSASVGADELLHLAVHRALFDCLGRPTHREGWLWVESVASAADVWLLGALLGAGEDTEFEALQAEIWSQCWEERGRDDVHLMATLEAVALNPTEAFWETQSLLETTTTALVGACSIEEYAARLHQASDAPLGPLLLHFQVAWWVGALRTLPTADDAQLQALRRAHDSLMDTSSPVEALLGLR